VLAAAVATSNVTFNLCVSTKVFFEFTKEVKIAQCEVQAVGQVIKKFPALH
jgi:hypothetical protein